MFMQKCRKNDSGKGTNVIWIKSEMSHSIIPRAPSVLQLDDEWLQFDMAYTFKLFQNTIFYKLILMVYFASIHCTRRGKFPHFSSIV